MSKPLIAVKLQAFAEINCSFP